jgi:drug/metabolite transporter (DMT)-like permease
VLFGILIGLMSGLLSALYTIFTRKLNQHYDGWTVNSWCYFLGCPVFLVIGGNSIASFDWQPNLVFFILITALVGLAAYSLYAVSMHFIDAGKASLLVTLDPVMSVTMSIIILGETLSLLQFFGCLLVGGGILIMERGRAWLRYFQSRKEKVS